MRKLLIIGLLMASGSAVAIDEFTGNLSLELRGFFESPLDDRQHGHNASLSFEPEYYRDWDDGNQSLLFKPFFRWDQHDDQRTYADIRELVWTRFGEGWEVQAGISKVFWGTTESAHLVDIINQTDFRENPDGEQKLGQPMVKLSLEKDWGVVDFYLLPFFREREYPGVNGRLRPSPPVDNNQVVYESGAGDNHVDAAVRWSSSIDVWDIGISYFHGTSRDPSFLLGRDGNGRFVLRPFYQIINQTGLDLQATVGDWLWKAETIYRSGQGERFISAVAGFEYTFVGIFDSSSDIGVISEYLYDDRTNESSTPFENDLFMGARWTANDADSTELLAGFIWDMDGDGTVFNLEASRRVGDDWKVSVQARAWFDIDRLDPLYSFTKDDYAEIKISRYF